MNELTRYTINCNRPIYKQTHTLRLDEVYALSEKQDIIAREFLLALQLLLTIGIS